MPLTSPSTSLSLLRRVGEQDPKAWERLVAIYGPLVYRWCRRRRMNAQDAADIMQEVFAAVSKGFSRFERTAGSQPFRGWLYGITAHKIADQQRQNLRSPVQLVGDGLEETVATVVSYDSDSTDSKSDLLCVVSKTLEVIRGEYTEVTWNAFWRTTIDGRSAPEVADELGLEPANVRQIKFRILRRIRSELQGLEETLGGMSHSCEE